MRTREELLSFLAESDMFTADMSPAEARCVIKSIATNPDTPCDILEMLAEATGQCDLLERVAENPNTPIEVLECLSKHEDSSVRAAVADNGAVSMETLWRLSRDADAQVRFEIAENSRVPREILDILREDEHPYVASRAQDTLQRLQAAEHLPNVFEKVVHWVRGASQRRHYG